MLKLAKILRELDLISKGLEQISKLKDLEAEQKELERQQSLFVPLKQKLERGRKALELGESYEAIKDLRSAREVQRLKQTSLNEDLANARNNLHNAEEALTISEIEYRNKLSEQSKLNTAVIKVKDLDKKISELKENAIQIRTQFDETERTLREFSNEVVKQQSSLEKIELSLRDARKFLQVHSYDEKLINTLDAIKKCYALYDEAEEKRISIKKLWDNAILKKQKDQITLNDRASLLNDITDKYTIIEKNYAKASSFYENSLKGKSLKEWRDTCDMNIKKLTELDDLYRDFQSEKSLQDKLKNIHDSKLHLQQETRNLNLRDIEQTSKINEYKSEVTKLEKRVSLLQRIQDLDAIRELLQDGIACPLCGSMTHPYVSGAAIPDPNEIQNKLFEAQSTLKNLRTELSERQTKTGKINDDIASLNRDEIEIKNTLGDLNAKIALKVANLGLRIGSGISPFEEIDRVRQYTRDRLQLAKNAADTIENAERDLKIITDEFEKIKQSKDDLTQFHQEAIFLVQHDKNEETRLENEAKSQDEITASLKRELVSQLMPYGYKVLPDKNPQEILEKLDKRLATWLDGVNKRNELERELSVTQNKINALKKDRDNIKSKREDLLTQIRATEADRDSLQQQRIVTFASKDPDSEVEKMNRNVILLRGQLEERNNVKNSCSLKLDRILTEIHTLETEMATGREQLQRLETNFGKKMLTLGFKSEDDYVSSCLTTDERRDLQHRLKELSQMEIDLASERENSKAKLLEIQATLITDFKQKDKTFNFNSNDLHDRVNELEKLFNQEIANDSNPEEVKFYGQEFKDNIKPKIQNFAVKCGFKEPFES